MISSKSKSRCLFIYLCNVHNNPNPFAKQYYKQISKMQPANPGSLPIFYKCVVFFTIATGIISLFTDIMSNTMSNYPRYTLFYVNLWRPITCVLISTGLLMSIASAIIMFFIMPQIQKNISTAVTLTDFFISNTIAQLGYCVLWLIIYLISPNYASQMNSTGIWVIWMTYVVRICYSDPDGDIKLCCFPTLIKKKYYPVVVILLLGVLGLRIPYDLLVAYAMGVVACRFFDGSFVKLSNSTYRKLEMSFLMRWMNMRDDFYAIDLSPKAKFFCGNGNHDFRAFYKDFMGRSLSTETEQKAVTEHIETNPVPNFSDMGGGISLSNGIKSVVTLEDVRNHWASKDTETPNDSEEGSQEQKSTDKVKGQYAAFDDQP